MKVTTAHMGSAWVALRTLLGKHGVEYVVPPPTSQRTFSLGARHAPEWMCLPYKILLGNLIEGLELGADTVLNVTGPALCRLGQYASLHERALRDLGFSFQMLSFNWQEGGIVALAKFVRRILGPDKSWLTLIGDIKFGLEQLMLMEDLERRLHHIRPRELVPGTADHIFQAAGDKISQADTSAALKAARRQLWAELDALPLDPARRPLRVGFLGEFYLVLNSFTNLNLEKELGRRGVEITRSAWLTDWAKAWLFLEPSGFSHGKKVKKAAQPYLARDVSGDAITTLGETVLMQQEGYDGIIQLLPFTCMPEIVAQTLLPRVTRDFHIPVLSLILDEQMGQAGIITRLEAFIDLMERRRQRVAS